MKFYTSKHILAFCAVIALTIGAPDTIPAQQRDYQQWLLQQIRQNSNVGTPVRNKRTERMMRDYQDQLKALNSERRFSIPEPITTARGELVVAQAGKRIMVFSELRNRVSLRLKGLSVVRHPDPEREMELKEEQLLKLSGLILDEWAEASVLALTAEGAGIEVSQAEIDEALDKLATGGKASPGNSTRGGGGSAQAGARLLGIPERQLRAELRDALMTEKYILGLIREHNTAEDYRRIYEINPESFRIPARVHGYHVFAPLDPKISKGDRKKLRKDLRKIYKMLSKDEPDYVAIATTAKEMGITVADMGWLAGNVELPRQIHSALFKYEVGSVSPIFEERNAVHILRVLEREDGSGGGFEAAIPQIENYLFSKTRNTVVATNSVVIKVQTNMGGLVRWREVSEEEYREYVQAGQAPAKKSRRRRAPVAVAREAEEPAQPKGPTIDLSVLGKKPNLN